MFDGSYERLTVASLPIASKRSIFWPGSRMVETRCHSIAQRQASSPWLNDFSFHSFIDIDKCTTLWEVVISVDFHDRYIGLIALDHGMARKQFSSVSAVIFQSSSIMTVFSQGSPWDHRWIDRSHRLEPASFKEQKASSIGLRVQNIGSLQWCSSFLHFRW